MALPDILPPLPIPSPGNAGALGSAWGCRVESDRAGGWNLFNAYNVRQVFAVDVGRFLVVLSTPVDRRIVEARAWGEFDSPFAFDPGGIATDTTIISYARLLLEGEGPKEGEGRSWIVTFAKVGSVGLSPDSVAVDWADPDAFTFVGNYWNQG
jgi:hypothetical protein